MLVEQMVAVRKRTEQLLQRNQQLREELSSLCLASASIRVRSGRVVSLAQHASPTDEIEVYRVATKPARGAHPHLVLLPGKE
jgi:cell division septum initiation protein DivIVA